MGAPRCRQDTPLSLTRGSALLGAIASVLDAAAPGASGMAGNVGNGSGSVPSVGGVTLGSCVSPRGVLDVHRRNGCLNLKLPAYDTLDFQCAMLIRLQDACRVFQIAQNDGGFRQLRSLVAMRQR